MKLIIDIPEEVRIAISQMGLRRIPDEMQKKVDKAIQHGTPIEQEPILDKIKAEIRQLPYQRIFGNVSSYSLLDVVIEIIDRCAKDGE